MNALRSTALLLIGIFALAASAWTTLLGCARAEGTSQVVVVRASTHEVTTAELRVADQIESVLVSDNVPFISMHDAHDRVLARSRAPVEIDQSDLDAVAQEAEEAIENAAFGRSAATRRSVERLIHRAERGLESLSRETDVARSVLDGCLALVRDSITRQERQRGLDDAMRCRRLVPDVAPSRSLHPASVIGVLAEADDELRRMGTGQLEVESAPRSGCSVYVNGRHLGVTPFRLERAVAGQYRVQVECERTPGRVHLVQLGDEPARLRVDTDLDRALRSKDRLGLVYERMPALEALQSHAALIARTVEADEAVLFRLSEDGLQLMRIGQQAQLLGSVRLPWRTSDVGKRREDTELANALKRLFEGRRDEEQNDRGAVSTQRPVTERPTSTSQPSPWAAPPATGQSDSEHQNRTAPPAGPEQGANRVVTTSAGSARRGRRVTALLSVAAGLGAASFVAAGVLSFKRNEAGREVVDSLPDSSDYRENAADWNSCRQAPYLFAAAGSALSSAAAVGLVLLTERVQNRWLPIVSGVLAVGLLSWGIADVVAGGPCLSDDVRGCVSDRDRRDRGGVVAMSAVPFLALPITFGLRGTTERRHPMHGNASFALQTSPSREAVELRVRIVR